MTDTTNATAPQPEAQHVIAVLQEELSAANNNRVYLLACLKQLQAEFLQAQEMWTMERESILKNRNAGTTENTN